MAADRKGKDLFSPKSAAFLSSYDYDEPLHYPTPQRYSYALERRAHQEIRQLYPQ